MVEEDNGRGDERILAALLGAEQSILITLMGPNDFELTATRIEDPEQIRAVLGLAALAGENPPFMAAQSDPDTYLWLHVCGAVVGAPAGASEVNCASCDITGQDSWNRLFVGSGAPITAGATS